MVALANLEDELQWLEPQTKKNHLNGLKLFCKKKKKKEQRCHSCSCGISHKENRRQSKAQLQVLLFQRTEIKSQQFFPSAESEK